MLKHRLCRKRQIRGGTLREGEGKALARLLISSVAASVREEGSDAKWAMRMEVGLVGQDARTWW